MSFTQFQTTDRVIDDRMNLFGNELISQITKYSTYDLYLKAGNLMNTQKPTGAGSLVTFANVTGTEQLAFTFNYAIPEQLIISRDNRYNMVIPFEGLEGNRSYIFRYVYTHEGTTIFDITRNAVTTSTGKFTAEFQALNQNDVDIIAEANSTVALRIYVKTVAGTDAQISLLVNDVNALGRLSRNEATAVITTDNVYEGDKTQETINSEFSSAIGQKANSANAELTGTAKLNGKEIATTESYIMQASDMRNGWQIWAGVYNPIINKTGRLVTISGGAVINPSVGANLQAIFNIPIQYRSTISSASVCSSQCAGNKNITLLVDHTNGDVKFDTSSGASLPAINEVVVIDFSYSA